MATTSAETSSASGTKADSSQRRRPRRETTLDDHVDRPSVVEPGDAPHDTTDPTERATSVTPDKAAAARAGYGTVNAVIPLPEPDVIDEPAREDRVERYQAVGPDGKIVSVVHNLETGETERA